MCARARGSWPVRRCCESRADRLHELFGGLTVRDGDSALATAAVEMKWISGWSAAVSFEGEFSNVTAS